MKGMAKYYLFLFVAIACEAFGTTMMKLSDGFSQPLYTALFAIGYIVCFSAFTLALKKLPLGVAYGVWSGLGVTAITIIGAIIWDEPLNAVVIFGIALIIIGVVLLESSPKEPTASTSTPAHSQGRER